jgi:allantoin racemase
VRVGRRRRFAAAGDDLREVAAIATRILFINPVGISDLDDRMAEQLAGAATRPGTRVDVVSLERGPHHVEYHYYEALVLPDLLHRVKRAEREGYDAAVIGCFYDFGLKEAREICERMVVTAPAESAALLALSLGDRFSVLVGRRKWIPDMREHLYRIGLRDRLASFRPVEMGVLDFQAEPERTLERFTAVGRRCVEDDGAEVILLGCTATVGFYAELQAALGVPVIDPVLAPVKYAEHLVDLRDRFGWKPSKIGLYESPRVAEIRAWRLEEQYPEMRGLWPEDNPSAGRSARP